MARSRGRDDGGKQFLTIALVLFVLLSIILGVVAFLGYSGQADLEKDLKAERDKVLTLRKDRDKNLVNSIATRMYIGPDFYDEKENQLLQGLEKEYKDPLKTLRDQHLAKDADKKMAWDDAKQMPSTTYTARIGTLQKQLQLAREAREAADKEGAAQRAKYQQDLDALRKANGDVQKALAETNEQIEKKFKDINAKYDEAIATLIKALPDNEAKEKTIQTLRKDFEDLQGKYKKALADAEIKVRKLEEKIPQIDMLAYDKPKARIIGLDPGNTMATLNIGARDNVRPGLTFSVFGQGEYKANAERKGSVEVVRVMGDHTCQARVTEATSPYRKPLVTNDELFNPAWTPGLKEHVAIAGFIDLAGDGRDGTEEFVRMLEKQGVEVDAYLDLREMALKGASRDITRQTSFLILGERPEIDTIQQVREGDVRIERKMNINDEVRKLHEKAISLGVTIVPARKFMALMGFKVPKPGTQTDWNRILLRGPGGVKKDDDGKKDDAPKKDDAMKKDDAKKDDAKKDDAKKDDKEK